VKSRNNGAFVHSIALAENTEARGGVAYPRLLLPSLVVSKAILPIVKKALAAAVDASRYPIF
jgi:hypothetical protein